MIDPETINSLSAYREKQIGELFDPGLGCPYTVSFATAVPLSKYDTGEPKENFFGDAAAQPAERGHRP